MGKLLCEKNLRDVWCRNEGVRAEIGQILHTHTHTRVSYSSIDNTDNASSKANYRPIALTSVLSKVFETALLSKLESVFETSDYQFGFKSHHSTDLCIYTLKEIVEYYNSHSTSVYICFMDVSKAFDRVNHWTLFKKNDRQRNASYVRSINSNVVL